MHGGGLLTPRGSTASAVMVLAALALLGAIRPTRPAVETRPERDEVIEPEGEVLEPERAREIYTAQRF